MFVLKQVHEKKIKNKIKELWKKLKCNWFPLGIGSLLD